MTKLFVFDLNKWSSDKLFSPIRRKKDLILFILDSIRFASLGSNAVKNEEACKLIIYVSKMSRITCVTPNKIVSVNLPFKVEEVDDSLKFYSKAIGIISSVEISHAMKVFVHGDIENDNCISEFADQVMDITAVRPGFWGFIKELLMVEDGYVRYDYDTKRADGDLHPLNHLDIFYSSGATFKLGLKAQVKYSEFLDVLDTLSDCHYLTK